MTAATPYERVTAYLDAIAAHNAASSMQYGDIVHGLNFDALQRSDVRAILAERDAFKDALYRIVAELDAHPIAGGPAERMRAILDAVGVQ